MFIFEMLSNAVTTGLYEEHDSWQPEICPWAPGQMWACLLGTLVTATVTEALQGTRIASDPDVRHQGARTSHLRFLHFLKTLLLNMRLV